MDDRRDPFDEFVAIRETMEHVFEDVFSCRPPLYPERPIMWETEEAVVFRVEVPGVDPRTIKIALSDESLSVRAGSLQGTIVLPAAIAPGQARATCRDGVLEIRMLKAGAEQTRQITVEAA